jgi:hypothetical protein
MLYFPAVGMEAVRVAAREAWTPELKLPGVPVVVAVPSRVPL